MRRRLQKACASAAIFLLAVGIFPNIVFCVGDNGHRALEFVSQACCHPTASGSADCTGPGDHCSSKCSDVRLGAEAMLSKTGEQDVAHDGIAKVSAAAALLPSPLALSIRTISAGVQANGHSLPAPRERHTTVQLC